MSDSNIILNKVYNAYDISKFRSEVSEEITKIMNDLEGSYGEIVILKHLPRLGKTYNLLKYLNNSENTLSLYVSDIHKQMEQIATNFNKMRIIKGAASICPLLKNPETSENQMKYLNFLFSHKFKRNIACKQCNLYNNCIYNEQFDFPENNAIITIAKESLANKRVHSAFDFIIFDENMHKAKELEPTCPPLKTTTLENLTYGEQIKDTYQDIKYITESDTIIQDEEILKGLYEDAELFGSDKVLKTTITETRTLKDGQDILSFIVNLYETVEWAEKSYKIGKQQRTHYKPYLHYAFDILREYGSNLIIANATFEENIYNQIKKQYNYQLPSIKEISEIPLENKNSHLLNYNFLGRNCSKTGLEEYGSEIFPMIHGIHRFCSKKGLKSGLITFNEYEEEFQEFDVIDHFVAHRGKNDFDNVDVLVILGTFNIPRLGILEKNYAITGEYLQEKDLREWKTKNINGCKITLPQNEQYQKTRLYLLYDEHLQAILRSGAHIDNKKTIITFGYVPPRVEEIFNYKTFNSNKQLINGYLTNIYTKRKCRRNNRKR